MRGNRKLKCYSGDVRDTSVYVHFPWCARKCPYCDFATRGVDPATIPHARYVAALRTELASRAADLAGRRLFSVFFGGGTPSLWDPDAVGDALAAIRDAFDAEVDALEVTIEANPSSLLREPLERLVARGVNRVSIGTQSLRDGHLKFLGRLHDRDEALRAIEHALEVVPRASADLMFGMPGQRAHALEEDVRELLATGLRHVSAYALTIEPGTQFGELHRLGKLEVSDEDTYASLYETVERVMGEHGLEHYEVSNYAVPGEASRHNQHYWRGGAYLGLGAAAVGCLDRGVGRAERQRNASDPEKYMRGDGPEETEELDADAIIREGLMLGLRTSEGVNVSALSERAGVDWRKGRSRAVERALSEGNLELTETTLRVPHSRWLLLDGIVAALF